MNVRLASVALLLLCGCSPYRLPPATEPALPPRLSTVGVYADLRTGKVVDELRPYRPSFALWSDGATKRRWIRLPAGSTVDTADMDAWRFPVGTELWKEFSVGGRRIETRVLKKVSAADDGWSAMTYAWTPSQDEAIAVTDGVSDALGTAYDIPSTRACMACHGGRPERVLGFGAIQLAHDSPQPDEVTLDRLVAEGRLSRAPRQPVHVPGSPQDVAALGYLHANCGHCHNSGRPADATFFKPPSNVDFALRTRDLESVTSAHAYATAKHFAMGENPADLNVILQRMTHDGGYMRRMPPLATETVDTSGVAVVRDALQRWAR